jgi:glutamate/tyrosine decarboxylase-like PLP-dependent enzyme
MPEIAEVCRREGLWMHVDGAYGAPAMLTARGRLALKGIELADSLALDPHKWLFQPFECGCVLLRDGRHLEEAFRIRAEYMRDVDLEQGEINFGDRGLQLSRSFRALKLWMSFKVFGAGAIRRAIDRGLDLAIHAEALLRQSPEWQVLTGAQMGIVTFRYSPPGLDENAAEATNRSLIKKLIADGKAMLSSTTLCGQTALRLCTINPRTTEKDLEQTLEHLLQLV